jgi:PAP2 superfamily
MRLIFCIYFLIFVISKNNAQLPEFPYQLSKRVDIGLAIPIAGLHTVWPLSGQRTYRILPDYFDRLQVQDIRPAWDRSATRQSSATARRASDVLLYASLATPAALMLSSRNRQVREGGTLVVMGIETLALTSGLTQNAKYLTRRVRPYGYQPDVPNALKFDTDTWHSFFSGHTSMSTAACFYTAQVYSDLYPESRWRPFVWGTAVALPATVGYLRYRAGRHFPTDILVGYAVGAFCGWFVPYLHRRRA